MNLSSQDWTDHRNGHAGPPRMQIAGSLYDRSPTAYPAKCRCRRCRCMPRPEGGSCSQAVDGLMKDGLQRTGSLQMCTAAASAESMLRARAGYLSAYLIWPLWLCSWVRLRPVLYTVCTGGSLACLPHHSRWSMQHMHLLWCRFYSCSVRLATIWEESVF